MGGLDRDPKTGLPTKSSYPPGVTSVFKLYSTINSVQIMVGQAFAHAIYTFGDTAKTDAKISTVAAQGLGWMYLGMTVMKVANFCVDLNLGNARFNAKVHNPDQHVYKVYGTGEGATGYIQMETEGALGEFNRAQRAHMTNVEGAPWRLVNFLLASFVFPLPAFCCACAAAISRVQSASGYLKGADKRLSFLGMFANAFTEGLVLYAGWRALKLQYA
mmetsp:Transcript_27031/g.62644  ORF Transcript_27031/g.62644 Transcript_27031/m.62644 type:complete len:217 (+) Transcript_27031:77-727(+)|eukprot:CAMPEP_0114132826 /NCGR_PEP_ID=MMETSP0043_2-20121206/13304_1 /TAXON_ID=464988 /ORGANISM="Hemiselmis andersenii, Strain CCMP644" /LENGTH=216 /DNA_ID=CAMNT_0001226371 /DNA_START=56 /DNA_END=706 /DNA_ORIENTATION=+